MVRTKDQVGVKVGGKSSKVLASSSSSSSNYSANDKGKASSNAGGGGNAYCPRDTPSWQKEITKFFGQPMSSKNTNSESTGHSSKTPGESSKNISETENKENDDPESEIVKNKENNDPESEIVKNKENDDPHMNTNSEEQPHEDEDLKSSEVDTEKQSEHVTKNDNEIIKNPKKKIKLDS